MKRSYAPYHKALLFRGTMQTSCSKYRCLDMHGVAIAVNKHEHVSHLSHNAVVLRIWVSNYTPYGTMDVITYPYPPNLSKPMLVKGVSERY